MVLDSFDPIHVEQAYNLQTQATYYTVGKYGDDYTDYGDLVQPEYHEDSSYEDIDPNEW